MLQTEAQHAGTSHITQELRVTVAGATSRAQCWALMASSQHFPVAFWAHGPLVFPLGH